MDSWLMGRNSIFGEIEEETFTSSKIKLWNCEKYVFLPQLKTGEKDLHQTGSSTPFILIISHVSLGATQSIPQLINIFYIPTQLPGAQTSNIKKTKAGDTTDRPTICVPAARKVPRYSKRRPQLHMKLEDLLPHSRKSETQSQICNVIPFYDK
jgi:hypothetical protein